MRVIDLTHTIKENNQAVGKSLRTHNLKPKKGAQVMRKNEKITALYGTD